MATKRRRRRIEVEGNEKSNMDSMETSNNNPPREKESEKKIKNFVIETQF